MIKTLARRLSFIPALYVVIAAVALAVCRRAILDAESGTGLLWYSLITIHAAAALLALALVIALSIDAWQISTLRLWQKILWILSFWAVGAVTMPVYVLVTRRGNHSGK